MTQKNKKKDKSISTRIRRFLTKLGPVIIVGGIAFIVLLFLNPIVGLISIPVISIVGYRYMVGGFKGSKQSQGFKGGMKSATPNNPMIPTGSQPSKPSQQTNNNNQVVRINLYGLDGRPINAAGQKGMAGSPRPPKGGKPGPSTIRQTPPIKPEEVRQTWENTLEAFIQNDRHKFLNLAGSVIEQALRHASSKEFGKVLPTAEAISALTNKNYFHYPRNHLLWLWQCRNDYAHEARVMKTEVDKLSDEMMLQIFEISRDIVSSCVHNI